MKITKAIKGINAIYGNALNIRKCQLCLRKFKEADFKLPVKGPLNSPRGI